VSVTTVDAVTFEIVRHKLVQVTDETIIALENVSGSPITNEGHDMMASLYKADGGLTRRLRGRGLGGGRHRRLLSRIPRGLRAS
jgi:hypothetical protein